MQAKSTRRFFNKSAKSLRRCVSVPTLIVAVLIDLCSFPTMRWHIRIQTSTVPFPSLLMTPILFLFLFSVPCAVVFVVRPTSLAVAAHTMVTLANWSHMRDKYALFTMEDATALRYYFPIFPSCGCDGRCSAAVFSQASL